MASGGSAAAHGGESRDRLKRANQHATGLSLGLAHEIQTFVHAVNEIDIGVAGWSENHSRSIGEAAPGVGSAIVDSQICLYFHNAAGCTSVDQDLAEAITRDFDGWTRIEIAREPG